MEHHIHYDRRLTMKHHINYKSFISMLALMFGFTIFSASVMSGGALADGMKISSGIISIIVGNLFLALYGGIIGFIARRWNKNLDGTLKKTFGKKGALFPSMAMILTQIGWLGVGFAMISNPIAAELGVSPYVIVFPIAILIIATAFFGIKSLTLLSMVAVPLVIILGIVIISIASVKNEITATTKIGISTWAGISLVIATFISGATFVPNFAVNAKNERVAWITTALAFFVGNGLMITFGFVGGLLYKDTLFDFVQIAKKEGFMIVGLIILIMNIWTTADSGLYSISLGIHNWIKYPFKNKEGKWEYRNVSKKIAIVIFGLIAATTSIWLFNNFINFLSMMNKFVPGIGAIIISSYILKKEKSIFEIRDFNISSIIIWAIASSITFIPMLEIYAPLVSFGVAWLLNISLILIEKKLRVRKVTK